MDLLTDGFRKMEIYNTVYISSCLIYKSTNLLYLPLCGSCSMLCSKESTRCQIKRISFLFYIHPQAKLSTHLSKLSLVVQIFIMQNFKCKHKKWRRNILEGTTPQYIGTNLVCIMRICSKENASNFCTACRPVHYCNQKCQKSHWKEHRSFCKEKCKLVAEQAAQISHTGDVPSDAPKDESGDGPLCWYASKITCLWTTFAFL